MILLWILHLHQETDAQCSPSLSETDLIKVFDPITSQLPPRISRLAVYPWEIVYQWSASISSQKRQVSIVESCCSLCLLVNVAVQNRWMQNKFTCPLHEAGCCTDGALVVLCCVIEPLDQRASLLDMFGCLRVRVALSRGIMSGCVVCGWIIMIIHN